jgi:hypothetical protein
MRASELASALGQAKRGSNKPPCPKNTTQPNKNNTKAPTTRKGAKNYYVTNPLCHWCKRRPATEADHLIEVDAGGSDGPLVPACKPCNATRGANYKAKKIYEKKISKQKFNAKKIKTVF